ncbi:niemann pick c2 (NPC2) [Schistosoma mansoni]|uniref:niemann pick c2 (NPC2) n=1 Tax=Schistosoma mansoni TaxID=6183 RepID=UPI00022DC9FE|nr:niemann pick c2 (NPC2) [Schistosoma mansoni]|eukprot:XP_018655680.1 niemann pick c2 (NPC2) [Schistosoma mansoni]
MIVLWLASLVLVRIVHSEPFRDCGSKFGKLYSLTVTPCDRTPCALYKGQNATITIEFTTRKLFNYIFNAFHSTISYHYEYVGCFRIHNIDLMMI